MIIDDTYDCYILEEDEDGAFFKSRACIALHGVQYIKEVSLSDRHDKVTEVNYKDGAYLYIDENIVIFRGAWKKFKRSINLHSIN